MVVRGYGGKLLRKILLIPLLPSTVTFGNPTINVGAILDYIFMTLGIAQTSVMDVGVRQAFKSAIGIRQTATYMVEHRATEVELAGTGTILEFMLETAPTVEFALGIGQEETHILYLPQD